MKRKTLLFLAVAVMLTPASAMADEKDEKITELEAQVFDLESQIEELKAHTADLEKQLEEALAGPVPSSDKAEYGIGDTWTVEGQWSVTLESVEELTSRNEYDDRDPAAVYVLTYTYENLGYDDEIMDGLYISLDDGIVDSQKKMGYSYPGDISLYPQETPVGASCEAQVCIGVDNAGDFKINYSTYDGNGQKQSAVFTVPVISEE